MDYATLARDVVERGYIALVEAWRQGDIKVVGRFAFRRRLVFDVWSNTEFRTAYDHYLANLHTVVLPSTELSKEDWTRGLLELAARNKPKQRVTPTYNFFVLGDDNVPRAYAAGCMGDARRLAFAAGHIKAV